ncbi:MAG: hypothetical protein ACREQW_22445 [Candidatus Binatia bacterium]
MPGSLDKFLRDPDAKRRVYHLAAAAVWGNILALILGVVEYNGQSGQFYVRDNWFLATVGLSAIMYVALALLKKTLPVYRSEEEQETPVDE